MGSLNIVTVKADHRPAVSCRLGWGLIWLARRGLQKYITIKKGAEDYGHQPVGESAPCAGV